MVFVPGLVENACTDPRVVAFAETLARASFVTLVPEAAAFEDLRAGPSDIVTVTDAALWLSDADLGPVPKTKIGITALSYGGTSIIAAARQPLAGRVGFVFFIGGYYEGGDVVRFVTTCKYRLKPGEAVARAAAGRLRALGLPQGQCPQPRQLADRAALTAIAEARLKDPAADIAGLTGGLGPDGQAVFALISNRDPDKVEALIAALPASMRPFRRARSLQAGSFGLRGRGAAGARQGRSADRPRPKAKSSPPRSAAAPISMCWNR